MSKLRSLSTAFWSDPFVEDLSPEEKLLFIYLITNEKTNMLGIYEASIKKISFETGLEKETVQKALKGFETLKKVKYINNHVILVNYLKHQNFNTNMKKSAIDVYNNLPKELKIKGLVLSKNNPSEGFQSLLNHYGMVSKVEVEYEIEYEIESEIEEETEEEAFDFSKDETELKEYSMEVGKFFGKTKEAQVMPVFGFLVRIRGDGVLEEFKQQFEAYRSYKNKSQEKAHGWDSFTSEWSKTDWVFKLANLPKKQSNYEKPKRTYGYSGTGIAKV